VSAGYRVMSVMVLLVLGVTLVAAYYGWGLPSSATLKAQSVRQGSIHGRRVMGGGPGFGK
jgi:hypothetical protein